MLLYMAIMQIFGGSESEYAFKKKLPSFLVWILLVPFTWLIVSWTLSFANQAVAAVLSIPMGSISKLDSGSLSNTQDTSLWHKKTLPTVYDFTPNSSWYGNMTCQDGYVTGSKVKCISPAEFLTYNQAWPFFIMMIYAYNIFKIQDADLTDVKKGLCTSTSSDNTVRYQSAKSCVQSLMGIVRKFWLALIVTLFFGIMLIALCWILLMRAIKLWIYIMLSPLFGLAYFTGQWFSETVWEAGESWFGQVGFKAFFKLAMVPVLVSAVLAFGLLFVWVVRDNFHWWGSNNTNQKEFCTAQKVGYMVTYCITEEPATTGNSPTYTSKLIIGTDTRNSGEDSKITLNFWDTFSNIIGGAGNASIASTWGAVAGGISSVDDIFAHLILTMLALVFMFMGVQVAAKFDPVTEAAFKPFQQLGESVGNFVAHSPSYLPLPHPAFAALTPEWMKGLATKLNQTVYEHEQKMARSAGDLFDGQLNSVKSLLKDSSTSLENAASSLEGVASKLPDNPTMAADALKKIASKSSSKDAKELIKLADQNNGSMKWIQADLKAQSKIVESTLAWLSAADKPYAQKILDTINWSNGANHAADTPRHITLNGTSGEVTGSKTAGYSVEHDNKEFKIPALNPWLVKPTDDSTIKNSTYMALQKSLATNGVLDKKKVYEALKDHLDENDYKYLAKYLGVAEPKPSSVGH